MSRLPKIFTERVSDWEVCQAAQIGGASSIGAGMFAFLFRSPSLKGQELFFFFGGGLGIGGSIGGTTLQPNSYTKISCSKAFSLSDLHLCCGRVGSLGGGLSVGYGGVSITAYPLSTFSYLFEECIIHGLSAGVGAEAVYFIGLWVSARLRPRDKEDSRIAHHLSHKHTLSKVI